MYNMTNFIPTNHKVHVSQTKHNIQQNRKCAIVKKLSMINKLVSKESPEIKL